MALFMNEPRVCELSPGSWTQRDQLPNINRTCLLKNEPDDDGKRSYRTKHEGKSILCHDHRPLMILYLTGEIVLL
jgi:hypothetical protein